MSISATPGTRIYINLIYIHLYISTSNIHCSLTRIPCHITFMPRSVGIHWEEAHRKSQLHASLAWGANDSMTHATAPCYYPSPLLAVALCVHVACICIFSNLASLAIAADFAKRYLPRAHGGQLGELREHTHTHMPLGPPIYSDWEAASQVFSLWRVEWFQVFQLPCHRESEIATDSREKERERETVPACYSCRVNLFSLKCRVQRSKLATISSATCHMPPP